MCCRVSNNNNGKPSHHTGPNTNFSSESSMRLYEGYAENVSYLLPLISMLTNIDPPPSLSPSQCLGSDTRQTTPYISPSNSSSNGDDGRLYDEDSIDGVLQIYNEYWGETEPLFEESKSTDSEDGPSQHSERSFPLLSPPPIQTPAPTSDDSSSPNSPTGVHPLMGIEQGHHLGHLLRSNAFDRANDTTNQSTKTNKVAVDFSGEDCFLLGNKQERERHNRANHKRRLSFPSYDVDDDFDSHEGSSLDPRVKRLRTI
ncbi:hypothetical protein H4219_005680 [Mycoemilia scoparia]|uniref:Uncharacterized protein n=1 Tax=Mycoemilia scoparia TaxID=417184 RepID=A0A9W8DP13_9FUNG|nr:hypothetical protein H4219_005680 [Mycoemilia scoparia]